MHPLKAEVLPTPDEPTPYRVVVWERGVLARSKPADDTADAQRVLIRLLESLREG
jgi:hypothetical protein